MIGECNTCSGKGTILAVDKPKPVIVEPVESQADIINAVANALPVSTVEHKHLLEQPEFRDALGNALNEAVKDKFTVEVLKPVALPEEPQIKVDGKKALYKRKTVAK
jgi:hypothetical protein